MCDDEWVLTKLVHLWAWREHRCTLICWCPMTKVAQLVFLFFEKIWRLGFSSNRSGVCVVFLCRLSTSCHFLNSCSNMIVAYSITKLFYNYSGEQIDSRVLFRNPWIKATTVLSILHSYFLLSKPASLFYLLFCHFAQLNTHMYVFFCFVLFIFFVLVTKLSKTLNQYFLSIRTLTWCCMF